MNITQHIIDSELKKGRDKFVDDLLKNHDWTNSMVTENSTEIASKVSTKVRSELAQKIAAAYNIDLNISYSILNFITDDISSDDIFALIKPYKDDKAFLEVFYKFSFYDIPANIVAKEIALIEDKNAAIEKSTLRYYANKSFKHHTECKELSISHIFNEFAKHPEITDTQIFYLYYYRFDDIDYGSITLEDALNNVTKYYPNGAYDWCIGLKPFCLLDSLESFFHVQQSKEILKEIPSLIDFEQILINQQIDTPSSITDI